MRNLAHKSYNLRKPISDFGGELSGTGITEYTRLKGRLKSWSEKPMTVKLYRNGELESSSLFNTVAWHSRDCSKGFESLASSYEESLVLDILN